MLSAAGSVIRNRRWNGATPITPGRLTGSILSLTPCGEPYIELRVPKLFNLRTDPYEKADQTSNTYYDWMLDHIYLFVPAQAYVASMLQTLVEFPQRQKSASFSMDQVMAKLQDATTGSS